MLTKRKSKYNGGAGSADYALGVYGDAGKQTPMSLDNNMIARNSTFAMQNRGGSYKRYNNGMMVPFQLMFKKKSKNTSRRKTNKLYKKMRYSRKNKTRR